MCYVSSQLIIVHCNDLLVRNGSTSIENKEMQKCDTQRGIIFLQKYVLLNCYFRFIVSVSNE